jgi:hypothetical protein
MAFTQNILSCLDGSSTGLLSVVSLMWYAVLFCNGFILQVACVGIDFFYFSSSYLIDTYFQSWVYVVVDWNVSPSGIASS